jgi:ATP-dependent RNA helicase DHX29
MVNVVDLGSPKLWTGRTPKVVLQEFISKTDRYAAVSYQDISGHSRAKRASVSVRWGSGKNGIWEMLDIACHSITQAEQYAATVALHSLIRPPTLGFASGGANTGNSPTSFRLLPAVFRDVWNDLEARRKDKEDQTNRRVWRMLKDIVGKKLANNSKVRVQKQKQDRWFHSMYEP